MTKHQEVLIRKVDEAVEKLIEACQEMDAELAKFTRPTTQLEPNRTLVLVVNRLESVIRGAGSSDLRRVFGLALQHLKGYAAVYDKLSDEQRKVLGVPATAPAYTGTELDED